MQQRETIRELAAKSKATVSAFHYQRHAETRSDVRVKVEHEKKLIYEFEQKAQQLEAHEEALIKRLQHIQNEEKEAFTELEQAMITASLAKRDRLEIVEEVPSAAEGASELFVAK